MHPEVEFTVFKLVLIASLASHQNPCPSPLNTVQLESHCPDGAPDDLGRHASSPVPLLRVAFEVFSPWQIGNLLDHHALQQSAPLYLNADTAHQATTALPRRLHRTHCCHADLNESKFKLTTAHQCRPLVLQRPLPVGQFGAVSSASARHATAG